MAPRVLALVLPPLACKHCLSLLQTLSLGSSHDTLHALRVNISSKNKNRTVSTSPHLSIFYYPPSSTSLLSLNLLARPIRADSPPYKRMFASRNHFGFLRGPSALARRLSLRLLPISLRDVYCCATVKHTPHRTNSPECMFAKPSASTTHWLLHMDSDPLLTQDIFGLVFKLCTEAHRCHARPWNRS